MEYFENICEHEPTLILMVKVSSHVFSYRKSHVIFRTHSTGVSSIEPSVRVSILRTAV